MKVYETRSIVHIPIIVCCLSRAAKGHGSGQICGEREPYQHHEPLWAIRMYGGERNGEDRESEGGEFYRTCQR